MIANYAKMEEVPIHSIHPEGLMRDFLQMQCDGLTGHIEEARYPFDQFRWDNFKDDIHALERGRQKWWPYEQTAYWYDGVEKCGELLDNESLKAHLEKALKYVEENKTEKGLLGPSFNDEEGNARWPQVVFFRALITKYSATHDKKILNLIKDHYHANQILFSHEREVLNVEILLWIYLETGEKKYCDLAEQSFKEYNVINPNEPNIQSQISKEPAKLHGVSYNEYSKLGAMLYICTGNEDYLNPPITGYKKVDKYQMLVDGLHCSEEVMIDHRDTRAHETCNVTDYTWAIGYILMATGDGIWADKIEKCIYNAGIGCIDETFKGLQYLSSPNQLVAGHYSNRSLYARGNEWRSYSPNPGTQCCAGNVHRFFPNFCSRMWMKKDQKIFSVFFGSCTYTDNGYQIKETTHYPFDETISYNFSMEKEQHISFYVRIPHWCKKPKLYLNNQEILTNIQNGFAKIEKDFQNGDIVKLVLPSEIQMCQYPGNGVYVEKGPFVYALGMYGERKTYPSVRNFSKDYPEINIFPNEEWSFALCTEDIDKSQMTFKQDAITGNPWDIRNTPLHIEVNARRVRGWTLEHRKSVVRHLSSPFNFEKVKTIRGDFLFTPHIPSKKATKEQVYGEKVRLSLVPMGIAKIRLTIFPQC